MQLCFEQVIPLPRATIFAFHEDPEHLVLLHRGWAAFRMLHHEGRLQQGSETWFEMTIAKILPIALGFEHSIYEPPQRFGEQLVHGPFHKFIHIHEFEKVTAEDEATNNSTIVRDLLEVELPWYYGGEWAMQLLVGPLLQRTFKFRGAALLKLAQSGDITERKPQLT